MSKTNNIENYNNLVCPHCKYEFKDFPEFDINIDGGGGYKHCPSCDMFFSYKFENVCVMLITSYPFEEVEQ